MVFNGGFSSGEISPELADALMQTFNAEIDAFSFAEGCDNPDKLRAASKGVLVVTHSAGALALRLAGAAPSEIIAFNPPTPESGLHLATTATARKTIRMARTALFHGLPGDGRRVAAFNGKAAAELLWRHPYGNFRRLGAIAAFDAALELPGMVPDGALQFVTSSHDEYYPDATRHALKHGVPVTEIYGQHDELVVWPERALKQLGALQSLRELSSR